MNVIRLLRSGILGTAIFSALVLIAAQPAERNGINLARFDVSKLPREMVSEYLSPMEFRMLGFTKKGWIVLWDKDTRTETDSGCYVEMHVLNLTNDSDIDSVNSDSCEISEEKRQRFIDRWQPKLSASSSLERFPLYAEGDKLIAEVRVRKEMEGEFDEYYGDVWLVSKERGEKKIGTISDRRSNPNFAEIIGFIRSPLEDRIAVVVGFPSRTHGSTKLDLIAYQVIGVHLGVGFLSPHRPNSR